jgi:hypothetical protein
MDLLSLFSGGNKNKIGLLRRGTQRQGGVVHGLFTAGWFLTGNHPGGNTNRQAAESNALDRRGQAMHGRVWQGLLTAE